MAKWRSAAARRLKEFANSKDVERAAIEVGRRLTEGQELPPTNLDAILPKVNVVRCMPDSDLMTSGELRQLDDGLEIAYSASEVETRRRFTIAHEIAHAVFERTGPHCPRRGRELEKLCDMVASQILVPQHVFDSFASRPTPLAEIRQLASKFRVSVTMMAIRCSQRHDMVCAQFDEEELTWCSHCKWLQRPQSVVTTLYKQTHDEHSGQILINLDARGQLIPCVFEWLQQGTRGSLCLLRRM